MAGQSDGFPVRSGFGIHKKGIIKRNEIITLLSSLMASGLKTNLIIASMESIVLDIFDSSKKARDPRKYIGVVS